MQKRPLLTLNKKKTAAPAAARRKPDARPAPGARAAQGPRQAPPAPAPAQETAAPLTPLQRLREGNVQAEYLALPALPQPLPAQESLAFHLFGAAVALARVQAGSALPEALQSAFSLTRAEAPARGAMQDLAHRALRRFGSAQCLLAQMTSKPPGPELLYALATLSLALLLEEPAPYSPFTLVDQAVSLAGAQAEIAHGKNMLNAILRRFLRERDSLLQAQQNDVLARENYPDWWVRDLQAAWGDQAKAIMQAGNCNPPLVLRVNARRMETAAAQDWLAQHGVGAQRCGPYALRLDKPMPAPLIPGFSDGLFSVQDTAAQLAAPLLAAEHGMRVLDACAAPGGKTCHVLELADVHMTALDIDAQRLTRVQENLQRLQLSGAQLRCGDASARTWWDGLPYQRIMADLPCSASGIVRRHPDIRWLRQAEDAQRLARLSARILDNLWHMLAPGGRLLLVTCSLWPQESELQAQAFGARHGDAQRLPAPGQLLPGVAHPAATISDPDGLFYALFEKTAA
ncbi:16S rRNA (cytosine(967)-C(5))-methyltransferase RsmB [Massilia sp. W12]|uniref:16S rRNA (cytosine(967)-C(5))-methyltransferase RsmB n=1 Tax=Massilia sp. W12 TaxID=3126507 RepID=UPI0030CD1CEF